MTLEGCVVRISDIIAYVGRDIEDAIRLGVIKIEDVPKEITEVLGTTNREIVNKIVIDIIQNSMDKPYIKLSDKIYNALLKLKKFNTENIYLKSMSLKDYGYYEKGMTNLFKYYLDCIKKEDKKSIIYKIFLNDQTTKYIENTTPERMVIDFIAGMTDDLFISEVKRLEKRKNL